MKAVCMDGSLSEARSAVTVDGAIAATILCHQYANWLCLLCGSVSSERWIIGITLCIAAIECRRIGFVERRTRGKAQRQIGIGDK